MNARGSTTETIDHLIIALDNNFINEQIFNSLKEDCEECVKMINGYILYLKKQVNS
ncbi:four helix bundle protein [Mucilaginibacter sp.]